MEKCLNKAQAATCYMADSTPNIFLYTGRGGSLQNTEIS